MAGISKAEREAQAEVKKRFESVELDDSQVASVEGIRKSFGKLAVELHKQLPEGRNKSLVFTHLEDASMRAIRAVSHDAPADADDADVQTESDDAPEVADAPKARRPRRPRTREVVEADED